MPSGSRESSSGEQAHHRERQLLRGRLQPVRSDPGVDVQGQWPLDVDATLWNQERGAPEVRHFNPGKEDRIAPLQRQVQRRAPFP